MKVSNINLAAFLCLRGIKIKDYTFIDRNIISFDFDISKSDYKILILEFYSSESFKFKYYMDILKSLIETELKNEKE